MVELSEKLDRIIQLTPEENILLHRIPNRRSTRLESDPNINQRVQNPQHLQSSYLQTINLLAVIDDAIQKAELCLVQFPCHQKPPENLFHYTLSAFMRRCNENNFNNELYRKENQDLISVAKVHVEYTTFKRELLDLQDDLKKPNHSFCRFQESINDMLEFEIFLKDLENEHLQNIEFLRQQEVKLLRVFSERNVSSKEVKAINAEQLKLENNYHDTRVIQARQLRYNKNLFDAQMEQVKKKEGQKCKDLLNELNEMIKGCEKEGIVFEETSRLNFLMIEHYKDQIKEVSENYDNDLISWDFEIANVVSERTYFEEMWAELSQERDRMEQECADYIESVRNRKQEAKIRPFALAWLASARKSIAARKLKLKKLKRKEKKK